MPEITNSRIRTIKTTQVDKLPVSTRATKAVITKILSARGSINFPKLVTILKLLAIYPSKLSLKDKSIKIPKAIAGCRN